MATPERRYQMILRATVEQLTQAGWRIDRREPRLLLQRAHIRCELRTIGTEAALIQEPRP